MTVAEMADQACARLKHNCPLTVRDAVVVRPRDDEPPDPEYRLIMIQLRYKAAYDEPTHVLAGWYSHSIENFGTQQLFMNMMTKIERHGTYFLEVEVSF
jgi:hypothetical protein